MENMKKYYDEEEDEFESLVPNDEEEEEFGSLVPNGGSTHVDPSFLERKEVPLTLRSWPLKIGMAFVFIFLGYFLAELSCEAVQPVMPDGLASGQVPSPPILLPNLQLETQVSTQTWSRT
jgi:hypothetical protein